MLYEFFKMIKTKNREQRTKSEEETTRLDTVRRIPITSQFLEPPTRRLIVIDEVTETEVSAIAGCLPSTCYRVIFRLRRTACFGVAQTSLKVYSACEVANIYCSARSRCCPRITYLSLKQSTSTVKITASACRCRVRTLTLHPRV